MDFQRPSGRRGGNLGSPSPPIVEPAGPTPAADERDGEDEQRVAITLTVSDGFRFGCGLILAGLTAYFALIMVVAVAFLVATILGLPLPFGIGGR